MEKKVDEQKAMIEYLEKLNYELSSSNAIPPIEVKREKLDQPHRQKENNESETTKDTNELAKLKRVLEKEKKDVNERLSKAKEREGEHEREKKELRDSILKIREEYAREKKELREQVLSLTRQLDLSHTELFKAKQNSSDLSDNLSVEELKERLVTIYLGVKPRFLLTLSALRKKSADQNVNFEDFIRIHKS